MDISLPHNWQPRFYQYPLWEYLEGGGTRAAAIWHRRAGKDDVCLHWTACAAMLRPGTYWHMLPEASQARKAIWDAVNPRTGKRRIDEAFPDEIRETTREQEMFIRFRSGSTWQVLGSDNYDCYSSDTEILTDRGWVLFSDLSGEELVATLSNGKMVFSAINKILQYDYDGEVYHVENNAIDVLTTPNHKFWVESSKGVRKFKEISDPTIQHGYKIPATCDWDGVDRGTFKLPPVEDVRQCTNGTQQWGLEFRMDDWCAFLGIFLSEGSVFSDNNGNYRVSISQKKTHIRHKIGLLLDRMGLNYCRHEGGFGINNKQLWQYCKQFGLCDEKFVPSEIKNLSRKYLEILVEWLVYGDGSITGRNTLSYFSTSKQLIDDFQEIMIRLGYSGNVLEKPQSLNARIDGRIINSSKPLYQYRRRLSKYKYFRDTRESYIHTEHYKGKVWCVDAGSHIVKVRRNGKELWCGNSQVGSPPRGIVLSEWAVANPAAWAYLMPILEENGGWALFISTPRGKNHCYATYQIGIEEPTWFSQLLTVEDTGLFKADQLASIRRQLHKQYGPSRGEAMFQQEYFCSWEGAFTGKAVYHEFDRKVHVAEKPLLDVVRKAIETSGTTVHRGWDHSGLHPGAVLTCIVGRQWLVFKEFWEEDTGIEDFGDLVKIWCADNLPADTTYRDFGDPAGNNTRDAKKHTPADYLRKHCGISITPGIQTFKVRRESVASRLNRRDGFLMDPISCPILLAGFLGGYSFPEIGKSGVFKDKISGSDKDKHADVHDALQYVATKIFGPSSQPRQEVPKPEVNSWAVL